MPSDPNDERPPIGSGSTYFKGLQIPMTNEQRSWAISVQSVNRWKILAERLLDYYNRGQIRFAHRGFCSPVVSPDMLKELQERGFLRKQTYAASGAWQYVIGPTTREWFMFILSKPIEDDL